MDASEWLLIIGALVTLVGAVSAAAVTVIRALRENTAVTLASTAAVETNTADRAAKTEVTNATLGTIQALVTDIHAGTGTPPVTVIQAPGVVEPEREKPIGPV